MIGYNSVNVVKISVKRNSLNDNVIGIAESTGEETEVCYLVNVRSKLLKALQNIGYENKWVLRGVVVPTLLYWVETCEVRAPKDEG